MGVFVRAGGALLLFAMGLVAASSCESGGGTVNPSGGGAAGGAGGASGGAGGDFTGGECDPPCVSPQFCSVSGVCLDDGHCADEADCLAGSECGPAGLCTGCEPPNMLIVLDRSCSMQDNVMGTPKWELAVQAIVELTTTYAGQIRFGLSLFPDIVPDKCEQDAIIMPVLPDNETAIQDLLNAAIAPSHMYYPDGPCVTNIDTAMLQAATEPSFDDSERPSYVLLISDGKQAGCSAGGGDAGTLSVITELLETRMIGTFVVGFGVGSDPGQLNDFALAGGFPAGDTSCTPDACEYYDASDGPTLQAALDVIAGQIHCDPEDPQ